MGELDICHMSRVTKILLVVGLGWREHGESETFHQKVGPGLAIAHFIMQWFIYHFKIFFSCPGSKTMMVLS